MPLAFLPPIPRQQTRAQDLILSTQEVTSGGDRRQFVAVGRYVHRGDPRWVPPLPYARQDALRPGNALLTGATTGFLGLAQNLGLGDEAVGAIAACAQGAEDEGATGWWGLFDAINLSELAERLFYQAETWLFENTPGIARLAGPASLEPLTPAGLLVDGFDAWPAALLPYNPPYTPELVEAEGYQPGRGWRAWTLSCPDASRPMRANERVDWRSITTACDAVHYGEERAPGLRRWLARLTGAETFPTHTHLRWVLTHAFARAVATMSDAGACFGIPDFAPALRLTGGRLFPFGYALFRPALGRTRRLRAFPAFAREDAGVKAIGRLYEELAAKAGARGYRELIVAPIYDEDEASAAALAGLGARVTQRFALYEKEL